MTLNETEMDLMNDYMRKSIMNSTISDDLRLSDLTVKISGSCIGRAVKIGRNVTINNSVIMNHVTIKDNVTLDQAVISCGCKIGNGLTLKDVELPPKTALPDKVGYDYRSPSLESSEELEMDDSDSSADSYEA